MDSAIHLSSNWGQVDSAIQLLNNWGLEKKRDYSHSMVQEVKDRKVWLMHLLRRRPKTVLYIASVNSFKKRLDIKHLVFIRGYLIFKYRYLVFALSFFTILSILHFII